MNTGVNTILDIRNIRKAFGQNVVLEDVSMNVAEGQAAVLIGPSGSGKSTLLRCINGLIVVDDGSIEVSGHDVQNIKSEDDYIRLRQDVAMVFQQYNLFPHMTVLENIVLAPTLGLGKAKDEAKNYAMSLLERVNMADKSNEYPGNLSGGQQQRVAIVRALAVNPRVMLFDEVTAALDPESVKGVLELIQNLIADGMTSVIVTHQMQFARTVSDNIFFTDKGKIIEHGAASDIFDHPRDERTISFINEIL